MKVTEIIFIGIALIALSSIFGCGKEEHTFCIAPEGYEDLCFSSYQECIEQTGDKEVCGKAFSQ